MINNRTEFYRDKRTKRHISRSGKVFNPNKIYYKKKVLGFEYLDAPENFTIYNEENSQNVLNYIDNVIETAKRSPVMLNFENTRHIKAAALLLLYSKIDFNLDENQLKTIRIKFDTLKGNVKTAIVASGIKDLLFKKTKEIDINNKSLPIIKGSARGEEFEVVIDHILTLTELNDEEEQRLGAAISETVGNVKLHAYPDQLGENSVKRWWIICSLINGTLYLAIYDTGVGIPETIFNTGWISSIVKKQPKLLKVAANKTDADLIKLSMIAGKTQTKERKHGLGSQSIMRLIDETPDGELWIFSNKGVYHKKSSEVILRNTVSSIGGTLVQWNIKIK